MSTWCLRGPEGWHPAQRVAAARALASRPEIVFADEPTGNLDSPSGAELLGFMQRAVREYGQTIVMVTHDAGAAGYADRVVFLADGPWSTRWLIRPPNGSWTGEVAGGLTMWPATIKGLLAHKLWLGLTALAIVLGVAFVAGTFILTDTMGRAFDNLFATVNQGVAVQVTGIPRFEANGPGSEGAGSAERVPASLLDTVRQVDGVKAAQGGLSGYAQLVDKDGKAITTGGAPTQGVAKTAPGTSPLQAKAAAARVAGEYPNVQLDNQAEFRQNQANQINQLLGLISALLFLAILIAFVGIVNTLALSIYERTREIGSSGRWA